MMVSDTQSGRQGKYWARALRLLWEVNPRHVVGVLTLTAVTSVIPALNVYLTAMAVQAVADAVTDGDGLRTALWAGGALAGLMALAHFFAVGRNYLETLLQYRMANQVNERIMAKAIRLQLRHFEDPTTYDGLQRATREAGFRPYQIFADLIAVTSNAVSLVSVTVVLLSWDVRVALVVLLAPVPTMVANLFFGRLGWKIEHDRSADRRRTTYLQYLVTTDRTFKETRLFDLGPLFLERFRAMVGRFYAVDRQLEGRQAVASALLGLLSVAAAGGAVLFAVSTTVGTGQVGQFAGYIAAITLVQGALGSLFGGIAQLYEHNLFLGNLFSFLDIPEDALPSGSRPFPATLTKGVQFRNVTFAYPGTDTPVLSNLNLFLPAGQCVALVGQNGAGKTTLVKLLARFYAPTGGEILIDGHPIEEYDLEELRRNVGVIFQDFVQYEASARENIGFGSVAALDDNEAVRRAAGQAGALPFIDELPKGLDTQLGRWFEGGRQLSGGEWQKVALARAFLRNAPIVVLDEPTAAIDAEAEAEIFGQMTRLTDRSTTLMIAHRFSTVRVADHIVVIDHGKVLEEGTHAELMDREGVYAKLFRLQAAGYLDQPVEARA
ncbi:ABC transporter ATP-binding protein [Streptosporangium sp. NPDC001681]|uniref:ABC transporter ATP-binding protein n=1 Tax=Streptosporangium sp. NPDC001681 TaxID=3154395 RepID=UPI003330F939